MSLCHPCRALLVPRDFYLTGSYSVDHRATRGSSPMPPVHSALTATIVAVSRTRLRCRRCHGRQVAQGRLGGRGEILGGLGAGDQIAVLALDDSAAVLQVAKLTPHGLPRDTAVIGDRLEVDRGLAGRGGCVDSNTTSSPASRICPLRHRPSVHNGIPPKARSQGLKSTHSCRSPGLSDRSLGRYAASRSQPRV